MDLFSYLLGKKASGGTGGVTIESGSNENGNYMKFSTGDLIEWGIITVLKDTKYSDLNLPVAFKDADYMIMATTLTSGAAYGGSAVIQTFASPQKENSAIAYIYSYPGAGTSALTYDRKISWLAIGKWK